MAKMIAIFNFSQMPNHFGVAVLSESGIFPDNRFAALDEFLRLLGISRFEWVSLFKVLSRANCGFLEFMLGDVLIEVHIGSGTSIGDGEDDWVRIVFRVVKDNVEKSAVYTFEMMELKALDKGKQLKVESFG